MTSPTVYIVVQEGVYNHSVYGPYRTELEAARGANEIARNDQDSYHNYTVYRLDGEIGSALYSVSKDTAPEEE